MNNWWKIPALQGDDNDYGDYDYIIEDIPTNESRWEFDREGRKCECCGKYHRLNVYSVGYFRTMDGYDSLDDTECWLCVVKRKVSSFKRSIKKNVRQKVKALKETIVLTADLKGATLKQKWRFATRIYVVFANLD